MSKMPKPESPTDNATGNVGALTTSRRREEVKLASRQRNHRLTSG